jgi:hypothetical protein
MNNPFEPGQCVVCVADDFPYAVFEMFDVVPWRGGIFTVAEVTSGRDYRTNRFGPSIRLVEFPPLHPGLGAFQVRRFRLFEEVKCAHTRSASEFALARPAL